MEFVPYPKIRGFTELKMSITQKIHGTNAQIQVFEYTSTDGVSHEPKIGLKAGSRNRWLSLDDDNYGFAAWVEANKEELLQFLTLGTHFGEWAGPGINSSEGLAEKTFILFDYYRYDVTKLPKNVRVVPVLYSGTLNMEMIEIVAENLKKNGSVLVPGYMKPEGIVISIAGQKFKKVFDPEETGWTSQKKVKVKSDKVEVDYSYLCQPLRLTKLLSKDERYLRNFPNSISEIVKDYVADLLAEDQILGTEDEVKAIKKAASGQLFRFVKEITTQVYRKGIA